MGSLLKDLQAVDGIYLRMENVLEGPEELLSCRTPISGWSAAEQLDHVLKANRWALSNIVAMLRHHGEVETSGRRTALGVLLLGVGRIPRGRAKTPAAAQPDAAAPAAELLARLRKQKGHLRTIRDEANEVVALKARFRHPYFGFLRARDGVRFVRVHSDHHLRIVEQILVSAAS